MISNIRSLEREENKPSAVSARPSKWKPPVKSTSKNKVKIQAMVSGSTKEVKTKNKEEMSPNKRPKRVKIGTPFRT